MKSKIANLMVGCFALLGYGTCASATGHTDTITFDANLSTASCGIDFVGELTATATLLSPGNSLSAGGSTQVLSDVGLKIDCDASVVFRFSATRESNDWSNVTDFSNAVDKAKSAGYIYPTAVTDGSVLPLGATSDKLPAAAMRLRITSVTYGASADPLTHSVGSLGRLGGSHQFLPLDSEESFVYDALGSVVPARHAIVMLSPEVNVVGSNFCGASYDEKPSGCDQGLGDSVVGDINFTSKITFTVQYI